MNTTTLERPASPDLQGLRIVFGAGGCVLLQAPPVNGYGSLMISADALTPEQKQGIVSTIAARLGVVR